MKILGFHVPGTAIAPSAPVEAPKAPVVVAPVGIAASAKSTIVSAATSVASTTKSAASKLKAIVCWPFIKLFNALVSLKNAIVRLLAYIFSPFASLFTKTPKQKIQATILAIDKGLISAKQAREELKKLVGYDALCARVGSQQVTGRLARINPFGESYQSVGARVIATSDKVALELYKSHLQTLLTPATPKKA